MAVKNPPSTPGQKRARILLVDDHPMVRERMAEIIRQEPDLMVCGQAEDRHQAIEAIAGAKPDLVTIDLSLKKSHGLDLIADIRALHPKLLMLVVSMHDESLQAERVIRAGAHGYITKQEATRKILTAIRCVLKGEMYLGEKIATQIVARLTNHRRASDGLSVDGLSDRELRVFELTGQGHGSKQIAEALSVNVKTVDTYRARIKQKLSLNSPSELLQTAINWMHRP